ncbi:hypothetical protein A3A03_02725 [Candidatus Nomurabacteria bacterium RIFCSPLOWO2_01_FULL_40_18]|uniref:Uncharacterized protein n=1 Tax=Candidatus Nomurabacteria bacterium RIFCSPLOWO2_01_FULL_40_18 TaxID=1801773 RepID=A0A1F6XL42_9BACT|nr:MAG: hypothetical protein A3A03_02725 [Candidatus Nomurabacteria bacterium RIFCSPLOWO2_01_FULL_40_18]
MYYVIHYVIKKYAYAKNDKQEYKKDYQAGREVFGGDVAEGAGGRAWVEGKAESHCQTGSWWTSDQRLEKVKIDRRANSCKIYLK